MVKQIVFFALSVCLLLVACKKEKGQEPKPDDRGDKTYAMVSLVQLSGKSTYAAEATPEETVVKSAVLFVFDGNQKLEKRVDFTDPAVPQLVEVTTGYHYFYAVVNIPALRLQELVEDVTSIAVFEKYLLGKFTTLETLTDPIKGFWMANVVRPGAVNLVEASASDAPAKNNVSIQIGRIVSKITIESAVPDDFVVGTLTNVFYKVMAIPNSTHLIPYYDRGILKSCYHDAQFDSRNYFNSPTGYQVADGTNWDYCLENSSEVPLKGSATHVIIKGTFTPPQSKWRKAIGSLVGSAPAPGTSFWRVARYEATPGASPIAGWEPDYYNADPVVTALFDSQHYQSFKYENGISYYVLRITRTDLPFSDPARYTIQRNSYYEIKVESIQGAGFPGESDVTLSPEESLISTAPLQANIRVLDWTHFQLSEGI